MNEEVLQILYKFPKITQRQISKKLDISLGKINNIIKFLEKEDYILQKENRNGEYKISIKGIKFLESYYKENHPEKAVILAAGKSNFFETPNALVEVYNEKIIERSINLLLKKKIKKIYIVCGYKAELFSYLEKKYSQVQIIYNNDYQEKGSFYSLLTLKDICQDDIILLDSDIIYEEKALDYILESDRVNAILVSAEKGYKNESFIEEKNGKLWNISKDIRELANYSGEMLGISKLSKNLLKDIFNLPVENDKFSYEYAIKECGIRNEIYTIHIDYLLWGEISNDENYKKVIDYLYPAIIKVENTNIIEAIQNYLKKELNIKDEDIDKIEPLGGMTNHNFKVELNGERYVFRLPGEGCSCFVNRKNENQNVQLIQNLKIDAKIIHFNENSGVKIAKYIDGAETLNPTTALKYKNKVAAILKKLHNSNLSFGNQFNVFNEIIKYELEIEKLTSRKYPNYEVVRKKVFDLKKILENTGVHLVSCHNDTVPENFIISNGQMYLIDWEYSGMNEKEWDIGAFCLECNFSKQETKEFIDVYFEGKATKENKMKVLIYQICQDFLWSLWTILKEENGEDFGDYGKNRYYRGIQLLEELENEIKK
ncbi:choline kinase [Fusobacterium polymorphum]|uniref:Choline kinase n=1 Tax=Fusobacterium nucleatum subsp. polymorphum TaxID=76857 RepID=A0A2B7Y7W4_FUSNP|nr:winged helix-turn-helix transcriptional regulator [Fusobacterium polymorphum]PGH20174.1 choline kinase [Fusobacterium polymorphum]